MHNSKLVAALAVVLVALGAWVAFQYRVLQRLQTENRQLAELRAEAERLREENQRLSLNPADAKELEKLRKEQSELLRLRDELSRLRWQLKEAVATKAAPSKAAAAAPPPTPEAPPPPVSPVDTYQATVQAVLAPNHALVTGGWATGDGKRTFVLIQPEVVSDANQGGQIAVQSRFVEMPDEVASETGFAALKAEGKHSVAQAVLNEEQSKAMVALLESKKGVSMLAAPRVSTLDGRQAQIKSVSLKTIDGETYEMGPTVDVTPRLSADQSRIEMNVTATLRVLAPPAQ